MQLIQIDWLELKQLETVLHTSGKIFQSSDRHPLSRPRFSLAHLGGNQQVAWIRVERFCNQQLACFWSICVSPCR